MFPVAFQRTSSRMYNLSHFCLSPLTDVHYVDGEDNNDGDDEDDDGMNDGDDEDDDDGDGEDDDDLDVEDGDDGDGDDDVFCLFPSPSFCFSGI